jgi:hypothetical protein
MSTGVIDYGSWHAQFWQLNAVTRDEPTADAYYLDLNTRVKSVLEAINGGNDWEVSDCARWTGGGSNTGYAWRIRRLIGGVATGEEWLDFFSGLDPSIDVLPLGADIFQSAAKCSQYFTSLQFDGNWSGMRALHYHTQGAGDAATESLPLTGQPLNTETVTIDGKVYTFQTSLTDVDGNVLIGSTTENSLENLRAAINLGRGENNEGKGTTYALAMTLHPTVQATNTATTLDIEAKLKGTGANSIVLAEALTNSVGWGAGVMSGGGANVDTYDLGNFGTPEVSGVYDIPTNGGTNPDTSPDAFMPTFATNAYPKGASVHNVGGVSENLSYLVYNHDIPAIGIYMGTGFEDTPSFYMIGGEILEPRVEGDFRREGMFHALAPSTGTNFGWTIRNVEGLDTLAAQHLFNNTQIHAAFTWQNQPRASDGDYDLDPMKVMSSTKDKGFMDKRVLGIQGRAGEQATGIFDSAGGRLIKMDTYTAIMWSTTDPPPFRGWPLNLQKSHLVP